MLNFLLDFFSIVAALALIILICASYGRITQRILGLTLTIRIDHYDIWIGLAVITGIVGLVHIFLPIQWLESLCIFGIGLLFFFLKDLNTWRNELCQLWIFIKCHRFYSAIGIFIGICISIAALKAPTNYDAGLYYFGSIRWLNEYPITPGLGNLYVQLAYNQSYFNLGALFNFFPIWNRGFAIVAPLFLILSFWSMIRINLDHAPSGQLMKWLICLVLCNFINDVSSPGVEIGVGAIEICLFLISISILNNDKEMDSIYVKKIVALLMMCAFLITIKISGIFFALLVPVIISPMLYEVFKKFPSIFKNFIILLLSFGILHALRGYILSGTLIFPSEIGRLGLLDWAVPVALMHEIINASITYNRAFGGPESILDNWRIFMPWLQGNWVTPWFKLSIPAYGRYMFCVSALLIIAEQFIFWFKLPRRTFLKIYLLYIPIIFSIGFWFFTSPLLRYIETILWLLLILSASLLIARLKEIAPNFWLIKPLVFVVFPLILIVNVGLNVYRGTFNFSGWEAIPTSSTHLKKTNSGLVIYFPDKGDQCWNSSLPCAPYFNSALTSKNFMLLGFISRNGYYFPKDIALDKTTPRLHE
jgi:hypothetical protein